ncbi:hypothetical protein SFUMM280S_06920 [Streptomyces fumanus]
MLLWVCRGPLLPPVVIDQDRLLMFSRTPGNIRKLLRNVRGIVPPWRDEPGRSVPAQLAYPARAR